MAICFPDTNGLLTANAAIRVTLPNASTAKVASRSSLTMFWVRIPPGWVSNTAYEADYLHVALARGTGLGNGTSAYVGIQQTGTESSLRLLAAYATVGFPTTFGLQWNTTYMILVVGNPTNQHLIACAPGGTPIVSSMASSSLYNLSATGASPMWNTIGAATSPSARACPGQFEEFNFWVAANAGDLAFPESNGVPDDATIRALANGTQSLDTYHSTLSPNLTRTSRFQLKNETDLTDSFPLATGAAVASGADATQARILTSSGPERPVNFTPRRTIECISQVVFRTVGNVATAFATIGTEGGTYSGIEPTDIQARLLDNAQAVVKDWTTVDAAPIGGTWAANPSAFTDVLMQASYLRVEFRARAGGGTVIAGPISGYGLRGAGFRFLIDGQSQWTYLLINGNGTNATNAGARGIATYQGGNNVTDPPRSQTCSSIFSGKRKGLWARGARQIVNEIDTIFPGVPIQITNIGEEGTAFQAAFIPGYANGYSNRWAALRGAFGVVQDYVHIWYGHTTGADGGGVDGYQAYLESATTFAEENHGVPLFYMCVPVSRYGQAGLNEDVAGNAREAYTSRRGQQGYTAAKLASRKWSGSLATVISNDEGGSGSGSLQHPGDSDSGQGRTASLIAWSLMSLVRAVPPRPMGITRVRAEGANAVIEFGPVNPF